MTAPCRNGHHLLHQGRCPRPAQWIAARLRGCRPARAQPAPETVKRLLDIIEGYLKRPAAAATHKLIRILSIEGGGIRSLVAGRSWWHWERKSPRPGESTRLPTASTSSPASPAASWPPAGPWEMSADEAMDRYRAICRLLQAQALLSVHAQVPVQPLPKRSPPSW